MGDGAITAVRLQGGRAEVATRLVRSEAFCEEEARGRLLYGPEVSWFKRIRNQLSGRAKPAANVNVIRWQERLLALPEGAPPYVIDEETLKTIGPLAMGALAGGYHSPHPRRVASRRASFSFRLLWGRQNMLSVFCLPDEGAPYELTRIDLGEACYFHDFIATPDHLIFFIPPVRIRVGRAILQLGGLKGLFTWKPQLGTRILVIPIEAPERVMELSCEALFVWHFGNAFKDSSGGGEVIQVDFSHWPDFSSFDAIGSAEASVTSDPTLQRATLELSARRVTMRPLSSTRFAEFPSVREQEQGEVSGTLWAQTEREERSGVLLCRPERGEVEEYLFEPGQIASEPNHLPSRDQGAGHLSTLVYDHASRRSFLALS